MRKKLDNRLSIILIILVAFFTVLSYFFDQTVIRKEDTLRNVQIKFENLNAEITDLRSISEQLSSSSESISSNQVYFYRYRNHFLKNILLLTKYDEYPNLTDKKIINSLIYDGKSREEIVKLRFFENYEKTIIAIENLEESLRLIYGWYLDEYFKKYDGGKYFDGPSVDFRKLFNDNIDLFTVKNVKIYYDDYIDGKLDEMLSSFKIENWVDLHKFNYLAINQFEKFKKIITEDINYIDELLNKKEDTRYEVIDNIKSISSEKNIFILASIISQILSLLFLLILFRILINR
tara:strand:+ start:2730 stop:3602 length:873 start_codon:yes stop_codon:yes gene_type:complete